MANKIPDPRLAAQQEAALLSNAGYDRIERGLERVLMDAPWLDPDRALAGLEAFHEERMAKIPPSGKYPEAAVWVEYVLLRDRELRQLLGLKPRQMAILRSLGDYLMFRGIRRSRVTGSERCRVLYIPATDRGALHMKNVDDPVPPNWKPDRTRPATLMGSDPLVWDGVGSGLHLDDEPEEIFPLPILPMYRCYADTVPSAVEFLTRYSRFFGGMNFVLHDQDRRAVAIEKCSRNFIEVFPPDLVSGFCHVSGMACRNPDSPQGRYQKAKRDEYRALYGLASDGADATFWSACDRAERMLANGIRALGKTPRVDDIIRLFTTPWPDGLNKTGAKLHPGQSAGEYTLLTILSLLDEKVLYRWSRDEQLRYPAQPEVHPY